MMPGICILLESKKIAVEGKDILGRFVGYKGDAEYEPATEVLICMLYAHCNKRANTVCCQIRLAIKNTATEWPVA